MHTRLLFVHALSPLHAGTGQGVGVIDLPIAREKATNLPYLPGSSVKGTLRDRCEDKEKRKFVFGPDTKAEEEQAGAAVFSDQRLLCLPIRSLAGTFAWVTSPYILHRFLRDAREAELPNQATLPTQVPQPTKTEECRVIDTGCALLMPQVYLEDLDLTAQVDTQVTAWATWLAGYIFPGDPTWQKMFTKRLCIVHDDTITFLLQTATEITARIKLQDDTKTVQQGGLWYEEALPTETILYGLVLETPMKQNGKTIKVFDVLSKLTSDKMLQLGGKATVGRGLCRIQVVSKGDNGHANS